MKGVHNVCEIYFICMKIAVGRSTLTQPQARRRCLGIVDHLPHEEDHGGDEHVDGKVGLDLAGTHQ